MSVGDKIEDNSSKPWSSVQEGINKKKNWATASGGEIRKAKKEETWRKKEQIETDNNIEPARPVTETKQYQPFDTRLKQYEGEEMGGVIVHGDCNLILQLLVM